MTDTSGTHIREALPTVGKEPTVCRECGSVGDMPTIKRTPSTEPVTITCPACREKADGARRARMEVEHRDARLRAVRQGLAVPPLYRAATLENFTPHGTEGDRRTQTRCGNVARRWLALWPDVPVVQVWIGGYGTGKGHLLWSVAKQLVEAHRISARVVKLADLIRELRASWGSDRDAAPEELVLVKYRAYDWLAIDEVSAHAFRGEPKQHLYDVVDHRLEYSRPTILTSNESEDGVSELLGGALLSRVNGAGGIVRFGGADYRLQVVR